MLVSSRSFDEYRAMFALTDADLTRRLLDCPGGAADFTAQVRARGGRAVAADPEYGMAALDGLGDLVRREVAHKRTEIEEQDGRFRLDRYGGVDGYLRIRQESARVFAADIAAAPGAYVAAALPCLPFGDGAFDLVLSSDLLFSYGDRLDEEFHWQALVELLRVTRRQVRLFPVVLHATDRPYPGLARLRQRLAGCGVLSRLRRVGYEFQPGGDHMLVLDRDLRTRLPAAHRTAFDRDPIRWRHFGGEPA